MNKALFRIAVFCTLAMTSMGCSSKKNDPKTITIAATPVPQEVMLQSVEKELSRRGFSLKIIVMDDYNLPNRALEDKEVDANFFQHLPFLQMQKEQFNYDICPLCAVHLEPMGGYSLSVKNIDDLPEGAKVAIPSDPSNEARAIALLEQRGLIGTNRRNNQTTTIRDVVYNPKKLQLIEVDPASLPRTLQDVSLALIPTNYALAASLDPKNALIKESSSSPYANIIAVRCADIDEAKIQALKEVMTSQTMKEFIEKNYGGSIIPAF